MITTTGIDISKKTAGSVNLYRIRNDAGTTVEFINYGGCVTGICVADKFGKTRDVVGGYDDVSKYKTNRPYFGALIGRVANRIRHATFTVNGNEHTVDANLDHSHCLHGGGNNFSNFVWHVETCENGFELSGTFDENYDRFPGTLTGAIRYTLTECNAFTVSYQFTCDRPTPLNPTSHPYFNLNGEGNGTIGDHVVQIHADFYLPNDAELMTTGEIQSVANTPFDFRRFIRIKDQMGAEHAMLRQAGGYDVSYAVRGDNEMATVFSPDSGIVMDVSGSFPCIQFYTANSLRNERSKTKGKRYGRHDFFCLEAQHFPGAEAYSHFPSMILNPGDVYSHWCTYQFSTRPD